MKNYSYFCTAVPESIGTKKSALMPYSLIVKHPHFTTLLQG